MTITIRKCSRCRLRYIDIEDVKNNSDETRYDKLKRRELRMCFRCYKKYRKEERDSILRYRNQGLPVLEGSKEKVEMALRMRPTLIYEDDYAFSIFNNECSLHDFMWARNEIKKERAADDEEVLKSEYAIRLFTETDADWFIGKYRENHAKEASRKRNAGTIDYDQ